MMERSKNSLLVRKDLFLSYCDHIFWSNDFPYENKKIEPATVVFCKIDKVLPFFEQIRLTRKRVLLVTGEGSLPCDAFRQQFLPKNVIRWFATNVTHPHPRIAALPLGLGALKDPVTLDPSLLMTAENVPILRNQWLYVNFRSETNPSIRQKVYNHYQHRSQQEAWITFESPAPAGENESFFYQLKRHHFVLCPPGNGIDTHRLWEALAAGAFPVALRSTVLEPFKDLPILFVDHFNEITLDFLQSQLPYLEEKKKFLFMLEMSFWEKKIQEAKRELLGHELIPWSEWAQESIHYGFGMIQRRFFS